MKKAIRLLAAVMVATMMLSCAVYADTAGTSTAAAVGTPAPVEKKKGLTAYEMLMKASEVLDYQDSYKISGNISGKQTLTAKVDPGYTEEYSQDIKSQITGAYQSPGQTHLVETVSLTDMDTTAEMYCSGSSIYTKDADGAWIKMPISLAALNQTPGHGLLLGGSLASAAKELLSCYQANAKFEKNQMDGDQNYYVISVALDKDLYTDTIRQAVSALSLADTAPGIDGQTADSQEAQSVLDKVLANMELSATVRYYVNTDTLLLAKQAVSFDITLPLSASETGSMPITVVSNTKGVFQYTDIGAAVEMPNVLKNSK